MKQRLQIAVLFALFLTVTHITEAKRSISRGRSSSSGSSHSTGSRRTSHTSSSGSVTKPASQNSHADLAKLSYPGYNAQANRPSSIGSSSGSVIHKPSAPEVPKTVGTQNNAPPIGWNVANSKPETSAINKPPPYSQVNAGPPPAYSPHNTPGGAKADINKPPPPYQPNAAAPPPYPMNNQPAASYPRQPANQAPLSHANTAVSHNTAYRHFGNGTSGRVHTPIQPQYSNPVMGSSYPHPPAGALPQGAVFYPQGQIPQGAVFHPQGSFPQGGYPSGGFGSYPPQGGYPSGGFANYPQQGAPVFAGSGIQPGIYPAGAFPVQKSSSGPGLGTGLIAGALGGAILGHALTPTHVNHGSSDAADRDRVIIINNTPGQVATPQQPVVVGAQQPAIVSQPAVVPEPGVAPQPGVAAPPAVGQPISGQPMQPVAGSADNIVPLAPFPPGAPGQPQQTNSQPNSPIAINPDGNISLPPTIPANSTSTEQAPNSTNAGYVACFPVDVNVTDPANPSNTTTVQQIVCYNYAEPPPQPETVQQPGMQPALQSDTSQQQQQQPDLMRMPGAIVPQQNTIPTQRTSTANLAANSNINSGTIKVNSGSLGVTLFIISFVASFMR